jgi:hypothetical protein
VFGCERERGKDVSDLIAEAQAAIERARRHQVRTEQISRNSHLIGKLGFNFLITDLELGMTFARIASNAHEASGKRTRNKANARRAYDVISRLNHRVLLSGHEREKVELKLANLRLALEELGEILSKQD